MLRKIKKLLGTKKGAEKMVKVWDFIHEVEQEVRWDDGQESVYAEGDYIELDNGIWIKSMRDGRFYDEQENPYSAAYEIIEKTNDTVFVNFVNRYYKI